MAEQVKVVALSVPENVPFDQWVPLQGTYPEDDIWIKRELVLQRQLYIILETYPQVTWWKGAAIVKKDGQVISAVETQDNRHQSSEAFHAITNFDTFENYEVQLSKAKFLGVHMFMYRIPGEYLFGSRHTIQWRRDG